MDKGLQEVWTISTISLNSVSKEQFHGYHTRNQGANSCQVSSLPAGLPKYPWLVITLVAPSTAGEPPQDKKIELNNPFKCHSFKDFKSRLKHYFQINPLKKSTLDMLQWQSLQNIIRGQLHYTSHVHNDDHTYLCYYHINHLCLELGLEQEVRKLLYMKRQVSQGIARKCPWV